MKKRPDPHLLCCQTVEKQSPRTLNTTPPRYPLDTLIANNDIYDNSYSKLIG